ncbi:protein Niban 1 [Protopterus annectens]|uniref:protein Niban 1 n=1 Tax=Protopterus annectens TaxID=7888 RepID=UPI001CFA7A0C|nr:protein Niban 1 [Protopterus annectens]
MGGSTSSQLDDSKCNYIRGKAEAVLGNFSPHYKRQYTVVYFNHIQTEIEQSRDTHSQLLKHKNAEESGNVLYETELLHFAEELKKWKDRYIVIKNDYVVDCHDSKETFQKGVAPKMRIQPTGGKAVSSEEEYNTLVDKSFPDPTTPNEKENVQPLVSLPTQYPVYFWHHAKKHAYFCFQDADTQKYFNAVLNDCIRHLNYDFLKQSSFEAQAFLEAVQFYRQEKGHYGSWDMLVGDEPQVLSNLVMEELLPSLQTDLLPKLKGKKNDRKKAWFATVEEAYNLVLEQVTQGFSSLQEECKGMTKELEGTIRSDMDQIITSRNFVATKLKATVSSPAEKCLQENIQPYLASILEELMGPVSTGFSEIRTLFENEVNELSKTFQSTNDVDKLKENVSQMANLPLSSVKMQPAYLKVEALREQLQGLQTRFKFSSANILVQSVQNYMQQFMEDTVYTFEHLLSHPLKGDQARIATAIDKVKQRVLKQYDYDSSTIRKKLFQEALLLITLPTMQKTLALSCKPELQNFEQYIFADYTRVIQVENVYEDLLRQMVLSEVVKVVKEAASLKKHNLYEDSAEFPCASEISLTDSKSPPGSTPASPARGLPSPKHSPANKLQSSDDNVTSQESLSNQAPCRTTTTELPQNPNIEQGTHVKAAVQETLLSDFIDQDESFLVVSMKKHKPEIEMLCDGNDDKKETGEEQKRVRSTEPATPGGVKEILDLLTVTVELPVDPEKQLQDGSGIDQSSQDMQYLMSDLIIKEDQSRTDSVSKEGQEIPLVLSIHKEEELSHGFPPSLAAEDAKHIMNESTEKGDNFLLVQPVHEKEIDVTDDGSKEVKEHLSALKISDEPCKMDADFTVAQTTQVFTAEDSQVEKESSTETFQEPDPQEQLHEEQKFSAEDRYVEVTKQLNDQVYMGSTVAECPTSLCGQEVVTTEFKTDPSLSQGETNTYYKGPEEPSRSESPKTNMEKEGPSIKCNGVDTETNSKANDSPESESEQKLSLNLDSTVSAENADHMPQDESCV